jgi:hypothetical protein
MYGDGQMLFTHVIVYMCGLERVKVKKKKVIEVLDVTLGFQIKT